MSGIRYFLNDQIVSIVNILGTSHTDDLLYLFTTSKLFPALKSKKDMQMIEVMTQMWTDFAIKGLVIISKIRIK